MSDSKPKSSIPAWQQQSSSSSDQSPPSDQSSRSSLVEQASTFLQDDSIRDAPTDKKIAFLESKGLQSSEIESLLGVSRNPDATSSSPEETSKVSASQDTSAKTPDSDQAPTTTPTAAPTPQSQSTPPSPPTQSPRDVPPIITYPEFLVNQSKPPPLVTLRSTLYTLYGAAGLGATIYGASEYLVKPMLAQLTSARHDYAETAQQNLKKLNEKLEQNVSTIPPQLNARKPDSPSEEEEDDVESITSDPTELFHRDVATQTSAELSQDQGPSSTAAPNSADQQVPDPTAAVNTHVSRIETIGSSLKEYAASDKDSGTAENDVRSSLNELQHYLDGLIYSKPGYGPVTGYGVYSTPGIDSGKGTATGIGKAEEDAISNFRQEIRGVKGALLSARNFPAGHRGRGSGSIPSVR